MSTKNLRKLLEMVGRLPTITFGNTASADNAYALFARAISELEAIEKAARDIEAWQSAPVTSADDKRRLSKAASAAFDVLSSIAKQER